MSDSLAPTAAQILDEGISDRLLSAKHSATSWPLVLELCALAVPAVLTAGSAGNVTCLDASYKILPILNKLLNTK